MIRYISATGEISDKKKFVELLESTLPEGEKEMSTFAQEWLKEGEVKGYAKGIHAGKLEGKLEGEHEAKLAVAKNMLSKAVDINFIKEVTGLSDQDIAKLAKAH